MKVMVIYGGTSCERGSSLATGKCVIEALENLNYTVQSTDYNGDTSNLILVLQTFKPDVVYIALHGEGGEDGVIQGFLEMLHIPYVGMGVLGCALSMNKYVSKVLLKGLGINVPNGILVRKGKIDKALDQVKEENLKYPLIVKANNQGSKKGIYLVYDGKELLDACRSVIEIDSEIVVEEFVTGMEIASSVIQLEDGSMKILPYVEIIHEDYGENFMQNDKCKYRIPANISDKVHNNLDHAVEKICDLFNYKSFCRIDGIVNDADELVVLEVSSLPGMNTQSVYPKSAQYAMNEYKAVIDLLVKGAIKKEK